MFLTCVSGANKAIEIMSSSDIAGGTQHLPSLAQTSSLAQLRSNAATSSQQRGVAEFLKVRSETTTSLV